MVVGLLASLSIRRRRVWLRITPADSAEPGGPTVISVGGLARSDAGNFTLEFAGLVKRLDAVGSGLPGASPGSGPDSGPGGPGDGGPRGLDSGLVHAVERT
jgi:cytochrome c biogenesis protein